MHPLLASFLGSAAISAPMTRELVRTRPIPRSTLHSMEAMGKGFQKRVQDIAPGTPHPKVRVNPPDKVDLISAITNPSQMASNSALYPKNSAGKADMSKGPVGYDVSINPFTDEAFFAHELGHIASAQTPVGGAIRGLRNRPNLKKALAAAALIAPATAAYLTPGDDDTGMAIAGNLALASPVIADEFLASKNALAMMDIAGQRATLGQKGKLAGALMSYLAAPILVASGANTLGNQFDEDI